MAQEVAAFLKGQDDQIIEDLRGKWLAQRKLWSLKRQLIPRLDSVHWHLTNQAAGHGQGLQNRDVFGYYVDKGWMCVQVFCPPGQANRT
ncbi:hypothetical protein HGP05_09325 [Streptococcus sanguinis]|uniref:Uncharacterized protein n=1 Tax=Streptococcus sanguinis TaxID=1305 RepID=A0A7Y0YRP0_STRSA|nr:hypothetical protein [Streptococcus sanguinis]